MSMIINSITTETASNANVSTWSNALASMINNDTTVADVSYVNDSFRTAFPLALPEVTKSANISHEVEKLVKGIVSDRVRDIFVIINMAILAQGISIFGVIANIINIIVFTKQGFGEAMTVTLTGLAVADLGTVICQVWLSICWNPWFDFKRLNLTFRPLQIVYLSAGHPRLASVRISAGLLAWATLERCLCITLPFKVREIITPFRSKVVVIALFIFNTASAVPFYYTSRIVPFFDSAFNRSYLILAFTNDRQEIDSVSFAFSVSLTVCSFVAVAVCTIVLVYTLDKASKWRESVTAHSDVARQEKSASLQSAPLEGSEAERRHEQNTQSMYAISKSTEVIKKSKQAASNKNKRAAKMVSIISTIFIVCSLPNTLNQLVMSMVPEYAKNGSYENINQTFWSLGYMTETVNASINIFMYFTMSSKYRSTIQEMLCNRRKEKRALDSKIL
ncbi:chemosensory receptor a [Plakobranchus ocellatus]|uniref:Chemosensory receptor a n=1 Tax=Plakobranchus ocellatus TaxID=259542 RepID=A0AAV3YN42_9GAST|nr:chemosensory receptor a [Plakobranchus ocellatus]